MDVPVSELSMKNVTIVVSMKTYYAIIMQL